MKMNKLVFSLAIVLVATLASTGCKKGPTKITPLPGQRAMVGSGGDRPDTLPNGGALPGGDVPGTGSGTQIGGGPLPENWTPDMMNQDRAALASYTVHFAFDSATVKKGEESNISSVAAALGADMNAKLLIEGHCDERGTEEYNRALGERRALALREALAKAGVDPSRVRTISYGKDKPADPAHDESAWAKNRRGDFVLLHPK
jgi:peptidoglycan-associated lipoprotein